MSEYEMMKKILKREYTNTYNPCENKRVSKDSREAWKESWESDKLLLCNDILFVFDMDGKFDIITKSY